MLCCYIGTKKWTHFDIKATKLLDYLVDESTKMGLPHLTSFFCCLGLETGSKLIGVVHLLVSLTLMVVWSVSAESARGNMSTVEDSDLLYTAWYKLALSLAIISALHVVLAVTLIFSVLRRNTIGLRVWIYAMCALFVLSILYLLVEICVRGFTESGSDIFLSFLEGVLFFGVVSYSILCVYSYYLMVRSAQDMEGPQPGKTYY